MSEASNVHPSEVGLATPPELTKKELAKLANIIAFFRDDAEKVFPVQGIEVMTDPSRDVLAERLEALKPGTLVAQRARIERDPYFRHPIPYIIIFRQRDDGSLEFFVYQRTKLIGEDLLGQKYSVALGGHPEADSIRFHPDWSFDTPQSLMACLVQELDEEATFNGLSFSDYSETGGMFTYAHDAFLRDDSDAVGLQHIGIVYTIGLPANVEVVCIEEELITVGFRTLDELAADLELPEVNAIYDFENWSRICIKSFADRIEATKAQEAADALFIQEEGNELAPEGDADAVEEPTYPRGLRPEIAHIDEAGFLPEGDIGRGLTEPVMQFTVPEDVPGMVRGADNVLYFTIDPADPDPAATIEQLTAIWKETVKPAPSVAAFAQELLDQADRPLSAGPNGDWKPYDPAPVDPSAETKVLTEAHREIGTTDDQMKVAVDELVRISDEAQPTPEEEAARLSDMAS